MHKERFTDKRRVKSFENIPLANYNIEQKVPKDLLFDEKTQFLNKGIILLRTPAKAKAQ